jgi:arylformamidase
MSEPRLIDISRVISETTAVWPGDTTFSRRAVMAMKAGCSCDVNTFTLSAHTGTHADAPRHFLEGGLDSAATSLAPYIGRCLVVQTHDPRMVRAEDLAGIDISAEERILFRTPRPLRDDEWRDDFAFLSVEAARRLAEGGARLVGLDTPSVDPMTSKTLDAHKLLAASGVAILESLNLEPVAPGRYELIALPLRIAGADASPVRAILRTLP